MPLAAAKVPGNATTLIPEWSELLLGVPAVLAVYCWIIWKRGFGPEDRMLFKSGKKEG